MVTQTKSSSRTLPPESNPVLLSQKLEIPTKPKIATDSIPNGNTNGSTAAVNGTTSKRKRSPDDSSYDQEQLLKRRREEEPRQNQQQTASLKHGKAETDVLIVLDDSHNGAILIDD